VLAYKTLEKTLQLEFIKTACRMSSGFRKMKNWTLWRGRPPPKWEKILQRRSTGHHHYRGKKKNLEDHTRVPVGMSIHKEGVVVVAGIKEKCFQ
jgi:hypothetical protein